MSDLSVQGFYQQMHARPMSGEDLEVLGKAASAKWRSGECEDLTEAVLTTVKHAALSPEQVKRVVEFTNTDAFLHEFKKEGTDHKVVTFQGGPADPAAILQDLNDGGGGTVFDRGTLDYSLPPPETKISSAYDPALEALFGSPSDLPYAEPLQEALDARDKLAGMYDTLTAQISGLEGMFSDLGEVLYGEVKQAALGGHSLGNIAGVMALGAPSDEYMKIAFQMITPRLLNEGVFRSLPAALQSMDKTAARGLPNGEHPLVHKTSEYAECLAKLAELRATREEVQGAYSSMTTFLKEATAEGVLRAGYKGTKAVAKTVGEGVGSAAGAVKRFVAGGTGEGTERVVRGAIERAPEAALATGAFMAGRRILNNPHARMASYQVKSELAPWTDEYKYETMRQRGEV